MSIALATDVVVLQFHREEWNLLLIKRKNPPFQDCWAFPGGFVDSDEELHHAALRELEEETGLKVDAWTQIYAFGKPNRDPRQRVVSITYASVVLGHQEVRAADDAKEVQWFPLDSLPNLAFDHGDILKLTLRELHERLLIGKRLPCNDYVPQAALHAFKALIIV